jgi:exosortase
VHLALLAIALLWSYWPTIAALFRDWQRDDNYSVGQLVPLAALYFAWHDRRALGDCALTTCWWGAGVILLAQVARVFGLTFLYESAERYSLVLTIAGMVMLVGGWQLFRRAIWILTFLLLMVPLPGHIHNTISGPLQTQATVGAVFLLELFGMTVAREGNVIVLNDSVPLAVAEACSGLRMLTAFVVVGSVLAYVIGRPRWQKMVVVLSTVPIAILCNLLRLVITAELFVAVSTKAAERFFHDFAGLTMMPIAIGLLVVELWIMARLAAGEKQA